MKLIVGFATAFLFLQPTFAQRTLQKGESPVFYSASELASDCKLFLEVFPDGKPLPADAVVHFTEAQAIGAAKCATYIRAYLDIGFEPRAAHYSPVPANLPSDIGTYVTTFLKLVADHPEEGNKAASTLLRRVDALIAKSEGIAPPHR